MDWVCSWCVCQTIDSFQPWEWNRGRAREWNCSRERGSRWMTRCGWKMHTRSRHPTLPSYCRSYRSITRVSRK